jgi:hypothetical protein
MIGLDHKEELSFSLNDIIEYNKDPDLFVAKHLGFSKDGYIQWYNECYLKYGDVPTCLAVTKKGDRCKNWIHDHISIKDWQNGVRGFYCSTHKENTNN